MKLLSEITAAQKIELVKRALMAGFSRLAYGRFAEHAEIGENAGDVIRYWRIPPFTVPSSPVALTPGETPSETTYTVDKVDITPKWYGGFLWMPTDLKVQSAIDLISRLSVNFGINASEIVDTLTKNVATVGSVVQYASTATQRTDITDDMVFSTAEILEALNTLRENKAMGYPNAAMRYICILHSRQAADLQKDTDFKNSLLYAKERGDDNPIFDGMLSDYLGVRFFVSDLAPKYVSTKNVYGALMIGYQAYCLAGISGYMIDEIEGGSEHEDEAKQALKLLIKGEEAIGGPLEVKSSIGWKGTHGSEILVGTWMVRIETGSSLG